MKKATLEQVLELINGGTVDTEAIKAEITAELGKGQAKANANRALYAEMRGKVIEAIRIATAPVTAQEIADATGFARGKVVWGLTHEWADEVQRIEGKVNTYTLA